MESKRSTAEQKVKSAIENLNEAVQILPEAIKTIDADLDEKYAEKARIESTSILPAEARREAAAEIEAVKQRVREHVVEVAAGCNMLGEFRLLPSHHDLREAAAVQRVLDLLIFSQAENLLNSIFTDAGIVKDWPSAIGKEDRSSRIALLEKSILEKEVAREALAVKFTGIKIFVDRRPTTPPEIILEFVDGGWNREKFSRLAIEFRGMQHQVGFFDEKLNPLLKDLSEFERQLSTVDLRFASIQKSQLETVIKNLKSQISDLRQNRAEVQKRLSDLNDLVSRCQQFLGDKGIDPELRL